jgi:type VI protein secretion system component VasF
MRLITTALTTLFFLTAGEFSAALAQESGAGHNHATEKVITLWGLGLIFFFPIFVAAMSFIQAKLDKRKDRKKAAYHHAKGAAAWRGGW